MTKPPWLTIITELWYFGYRNPRWISRLNYAVYHTQITMFFKIMVNHGLFLGRDVLLCVREIKRSNFFH